LLSTSGVPMSDAHLGISPLEQEWRSCVTAIAAAAEILRDHRCLHDSERDRFVAAIIEESDRLRRTFEHTSGEQTTSEQTSGVVAALSPSPADASMARFVGF